MFTREKFEDLEKQNLAPYAMKSGESAGRLYKEDEHSFRTRFQRDRDRVVHSRAFRRLMYKTQVFVNHEGDHYRTRLTHSLEVAQIARTISRTLRLNEDLAEVIALTHDLGHPPFGHSGQDVLNELMKDAGGFEHNKQSFRIVTFLEHRYPDFMGLNLSREVLEGICKHNAKYELPDGSLFERKGFPSLEAQLTNIADEIAYNNHDIDDGLSSSLINLDQLKEIEIWQSNFEKIRNLNPKETEKIIVSQTVKSVINLLVSDLIENTLKNIDTLKIKSVEDVQQNGKDCVGFSPEVKKQNAELKKFLYKNLYRHYRVERMASKAERILKELFKEYLRHPQILPSTPIEHKSDNELKRQICDFIAGMTDRYAMEEYQKLFDPFERV